MGPLICNLVIYTCILYESFQMDLSSAMQLLHTVELQKKVPKWFRSLLIRALLLLAFTVTVMVVRVKIMKAELPVFTV